MGMLEQCGFSRVVWIYTTTTTSTHLSSVTLTLFLHLSPQPHLMPHFSTSSLFTSPHLSSLLSPHFSLLTSLHLFSPLLTSPHLSSPLLTSLPDAVVLIPDVIAKQKFDTL